MAKDDIILSPKHGVNAAIPNCFFCGKKKNMLVLFGRLKNDAEAPKDCVLDDEPCDECAGYMKQGVLLISVDAAKSQSRSNPYRTGGWAVVKDEAIVRAIKEPELRDQILAARFSFIDDETWRLLGLPTLPGDEGGEAPNEEG